MYKKGSAITLRRVPRSPETAMFPAAWREMSTDRFKCYFNGLTKVLTTFDEF